MDEVEVVRQPKDRTASWASSPDARTRMRATRRRDTRPELEVRRLLHAAGLRYRVDWPLPTNPRRRADIAFTRQKLVVFIDGCFWHRCPQHYVAPRSNEDYWDTKTSANSMRDVDTDQGLQAAGWLVLRFWEHQEPALIAAAVGAELSRRALLRGVQSGDSVSAPTPD